jgi:hypothetical protein
MKPPDEELSHVRAWGAPAASAGVGRDGGEKTCRILPNHSSLSLLHCDRETLPSRTIRLTLTPQILETVPESSLAMVTGKASRE